MTNPMKRPGPGDLLTHAFEVINARGSDYDNANDIEQNMREVAGIASVILGKEITARDVCLIHHCTKLIRSKSAPGKLDNYVDGASYLAFAACCTGLVPLPAIVPAPQAPVVPVSRREPVASPATVARLAEAP